MQVAVKGLTAREAEVLGHVAEGRFNQDIGDRLGISARSVKKHLQRIYTKLAVTSRMAAVLSMVRHRS